MLQLNPTATFIFTSLTAAALTIPITHPLPLPDNSNTLFALTTSALVQDGTGGLGEVFKVFATRDEASGGISGIAIGGIVAGVVFGIPLLVFIIARFCRAAPTPLNGQGGYPHPQAKVKFLSFNQPGPYAAHLTPPPPAYAHGMHLQQQQQYYSPYAAGGHIEMPQTVHHSTGGSFYAPAAQPQYTQEEERGVRFGPVGVRRYRG